MTSSESGHATLEAHGLVGAEHHSDAVVVARRGHTGVVLLDRPEVGNAHNRAMIRALAETWLEFDDDPHVRCMVMGSTSDRYFCTGIDLKEVAESRFGDEHRMRGTGQTHRDVPVWKPMVTAAEGMVVGGGLHWGGEADIVVASERATFRDTHVNVRFVGNRENLGLALKAGLGSALYLSLVGSSAILDACRGQELGLVQEVVPPGEALRRALELADVISANSPSAMANELRTLWAFARMHYDDGASNDHGGSSAAPARAGRRAPLRRVPRARRRTAQRRVRRADPRPDDHGRTSRPQSRPAERQGGRVDPRDLRPRGRPHRADRVRSRADARRPHARQRHDHVLAGGRIMSRALVLWSKDEPDPIRHTTNVAMPAVAGPDDPAGRDDGRVFPGAVGRIVHGVDTWSADEPLRDPVQHVWTRYDRSFPVPVVNQAILSWATDGYLIGTAMLPQAGYHEGQAHRTISTGVISHTVSFHDRFDVSHRLLLSNESIWAGRGRRYGVCNIWTQDGRPVASCTQDNLVRGLPRPPRPHRRLPAHHVTGTHRMEDHMEFIEYEVVDRVAVITLDRPEKANAQHRPLLVELNQAFEAAVADDDVHVVLLQANGRHFSAGHDLAGASRPQTDGNGAPKPWTLDEMYRSEAEYFLGYSLAWRNIPKPSIAAVQGKCIAAGLMLCWPCDLIIAADNAEFSDPTARMGLAGVEYMAHAWELGPRKAKELLFRSTAITADEALALGMVNKVVPLEQLRDEAMTWARDIATLDPIMTRLIKRGINSTLDIMGFTSSLSHHFDIHELAHGIMASMRAANPDVRPVNILDHMRATNQSIAERQATERERSAP